jgi:hypothetical protein
MKDKIIKNQNYKQSKVSNKNIFVIISIIFTISLFMRLYYFDYNIPLTSDSLNYFFYAMDIKINEQLPVNYSLANNGWPMFVSLFFSIFQSNDINDYMQLQRIITILISSLTIIPIYLLCKRFFNSTFSLIGAAIIGFEPHLIQNSLFGISDTFYIFLVSTTLYLFLSSKQKWIYLSFGLIAISTIVRSEGIFLFFTLSLMYFLIYRKNKENLKKYIFALTIFIIILTPMIFYQYSNFGDDRMFSRAGIAISGHILSSDCTNCGSDNISGIPFIMQGFENFPKYLGWNMIPVWISFVPIGIVIIFKKINVKSSLLISSMIIMSLPAFYAYSIPLQDGRYLFFLYPIFSVISLFTIHKFLEYIPNNKNKIMIIIIILSLIIFTSIIYLNEKINNNYEQESFKIAKILSDSKKIINEYSPENKYLEVSNINFNLKDFELYFLDKRTIGESVKSSLQQDVTYIQINNLDSIDEIIKLNEKNEITHLVVDAYNQNEILKNIYKNEEQYNFLKKIFDSNEEKFEKEIKIFEIDYKKYNLTKILNKDK